MHSLKLGLSVVINDADGTVGRDEGTMDADPKETTPKPLHF
jgi:hypothetical protein